MFEEGEPCPLCWEYPIEATRIGKEVVSLGCPVCAWVQEWSPLWSEPFLIKLQKVDKPVEEVPALIRLSRLK